MTNAIRFRLSGRIAHFLRAEAGVTALSYPIPTRTVMLGIIGAVLGLEKDTPQALLEPFQIAVSGKAPLTHWHRVKLRKDPPAALPLVIKKTQKRNVATRTERASLIVQEWLINPGYDAWAILPEPFHSEFESRLRKRRWHFQPSLGLSEMMAELEYIALEPAKKLVKAVYPVNSVINQEHAEVELKELYENRLSIQLLRMPRMVTPERVFTHATYLYETQVRPVPIKTSEAYSIGDKVVMFL
ncbi:MAG: CRISPR-associated protein Cas5 [Dethiobacteria bacterium]|jgi:CRISPR-associated protein Cas5h